MEQNRGVNTGDGKVLKISENTMNRKDATGTKYCIIRNKRDNKTLKGKLNTDHDRHKVIAKQKTNRKQMFK